MAEAETSIRVDWWRVLADLNKTGRGFREISTEAQIPLSTLAGYKNLNVEPKHADGERLLAMWRRHCMPSVPFITGNVRNRERGG